MMGIGNLPRNIAGSIGCTVSSEADAYCTGPARLSRRRNIVFRARLSGRYARSMLSPFVSGNRGATSPPGG
jgi:hypothetical protein